MSQGIFRLQRRERFAQIDTQGLEDQKLSFKAKGVWCYLMSRTDDWTTRVHHLASVSRDGVKAVRSALDELIKHEYARRRQLRNEDGTYQPVEWWILEAPPSILRKRMPAAEWEAFREEWAKWEEPDEEPEPAKEPDRQNGEAVKNRPDHQNGEAVDSPDHQNGEAVDSPDRQKGEAVDSPDRQNRDTGLRDADNGTLRKNDLTKERTKYDGGKSVSREKAGNLNRQTDRQTTEKKEEAVWNAVDSATTREFLELLCDWLELDWRRVKVDGLEEVFSPKDWRRSRIWLADKMERLKKKKYTDIGIWDMVLKDVSSEQCPRPPARPQRRKANRFSEKNAEPKEKAQVVITDEMERWPEVLDHLREMVSRDFFERWFAELETLGWNDDSQLVCVTDDKFTTTFIEDNYIDLIETSVSEVLGEAKSVVMAARGEVVTVAPDSASAAS